MLLQQGTEFLQHRWWPIINLLQKRRGLATVVGTVFFVIVATSIIAYVTYSMDLIENYSESIGVKQTLDYERQTEEFQVVKVDTVSNKFNITLQNIGNIPVNVTRLWVKNTTDTNWQMAKYDINTGIAPGATVTNVGQNIDLISMSTQSYMMKFVTSRGSAESFNVNSVTEKPLYMQLHTIPNVISTGFPVSLVFTVANNMSNNNILFNLSPNLDVNANTGTSSFQYVSGPIPAQYPLLAPGDVAIFEYVYSVSGVENDSVDFGASLVNGYSIDASHKQSLNSTVTVKNVELAEQAGISIQSLGLFLKIFSDDILILKDETDGVPGGNYQMDPLEPSGPGTVITFDEGVKKQWFSNNVTGSDIVIPAGIWNASLRYNSARLPDGMAAGASIIHDTATNGGGHTLHFNTDTTKARFDSGQMTTCTDLVDSGTLSGATWSALGGVNASGAYFFDGDDYISIANSGVKKSCNWVDNLDMSVAGWFNGTITASNNAQTIFSREQLGEGGFEVAIGDGDAASKGHVIFTFTDKDGDAVVCESSGTDYLDEEWHHFVGVYDKDGQDCELYVDGVSKDIDSNGLMGHEHEATNPIYMGMRSGSTN